MVFLLWFVFTFCVLSFLLLISWKRCLFAYSLCLLLQTTPKLNRIYVLTFVLIWSCANEFIFWLSFLINAFYWVDVCLFWSLTCLLPRATPKTNIFSAYHRLDEEKKKNIKSFCQIRSNYCIVRRRHTRSCLYQLCEKLLSTFTVVNNCSSPRNKHPSIQFVLSKSCLLSLCFWSSEVHCNIPRSL